MATNEQNSESFDSQIENIDSETNFAEDDEFNPRRAKSASIFDDNEGFGSLRGAHDDEDDGDGFDLEHDMAIQGTEFIKGSDDHSDPAMELKRKKSLKVVLLFALILAAVIAGAAVIFNIMETAKNESMFTPQTIAPSPTATGIVDDPAITKALHPLLAIFPKAPKVSASVETVTLTDNAVTNSSGSSLTSIGSVMTAATTTCEVTQPTDFCLAARGKAGEVTYDVYYLKDAAHSRLFENPSNFKQKEIVGASAAGTLDLKMGENVATTLAAVNADSSGWMIVFQTGEAAGIDAVIEATTVTQTI